MNFTLNTDHIQKSSLSWLSLIYFPINLSRTRPKYKNKAERPATADSLLSQHGQALYQESSHDNIYSLNRMFVFLEAAALTKHTHCMLLTPYFKLRHTSCVLPCSPGVRVVKGTPRADSKADNELLTCCLIPSFCATSWCQPPVCTETAKPSLSIHPTSSVPAGLKATLLVSEQGRGTTIPGEPRPTQAV